VICLKTEVSLFPSKVDTEGRLSVSVSTQHQPDWIIGMGYPDVKSKRRASANFLAKV